MFFVIFLGTVFFLFGFLYIFKGFWSRTTQEVTGPRIPPPSPVCEFLVLTRLKSYSRESGRLPRSERPFLPVVRALFWASTWRGVLVNGSAGHDVIKNNTQERN